MIQCLYVGLGGFVGASFRYMFMQLPIGGGNFPIKTLLINFIGAILVGLLTEATGEFPPVTSNQLLFLEMGVCGGFTAFSAFGIETVMLLEKGEHNTALAYIALSVVLCLVGIVLGEFIVKSVRG